MTNYEKLRKRYKITIWILIIGFLLFILSLTTTNEEIMSTLGPISLMIVVTDFFIFKYYKKILEQADIIKIGTEQAIKDNENTNNTKQNQNRYITKESLTTECENKFYKILKDNFSDKYEIHPQVPLSSVIEKQKTFDNQYQNELYRIIDFGIFSKDTLKPLLLIEINDKTHKNKERIERDNKVKEICEIANIELITFWTDYPNEENYIIKRIKTILEY